MWRPIRIEHLVWSQSKMTNWNERGGLWAQKRCSIQEKKTVLQMVFVPRLLGAEENVVVSSPPVGYSRLLSFDQRHWIFTWNIEFTYKITLCLNG